MAGEVSAGVQKPMLRGLHQATIKRNLAVSAVLVSISVVLLKFGRNEPRKRDYAEFYKWVLGRNEIDFNDLYFFWFSEPMTITQCMSAWGKLDYCSLHKIKCFFVLQKIDFSQNLPELSSFIWNVYLQKKNIVKQKISQ